MPLFSRAIALITAAMLITIAAPLYAESAPVFDADTMPQQFDGDSDQGQQQDAPPPSSDNAFVPVQTQPASSSSSSSGASTGSIDKRVQHLEEQMNNIQGADNSGVRVDSLQEQVQTLRGQVEELTHQLQQMQAQQKTMYSDLDKRLSQMSSDNKASKKIAAGVTSDETDALPSKPASKLAAAKQNAKATVGADTVKKLDDQPNVAEEQQIYQTAYNLIKAKKYNDAVTALQGMLKKYPSGQFASNAHYWLGELYGLMGKNDLALNEFGTVVSTFPDSPRVSDAQLKVGLIYSSQSKWSDAKASFKKVINRYPGTASARVASEQLKQIKVAGH